MLSKCSACKRYLGVTLKTKYASGESIYSKYEAGSNTIGT